MSLPSIGADCGGVIRRGGGWIVILFLKRSASLESMVDLVLNSSDFFNALL